MLLGFWVRLPDRPLVDARARASDEGLAFLERLAGVDEAAALDEAAGLDWGHQSRPRGRSCLGGEPNV